MDLLTFCAYLILAMMRQLLTLLALITGLAAPLAPVEARVAGGHGAQVQLAGEAAAATVAQAGVCHAIPDCALVPIVPAAALAVEAQAVLAAPALRIGIDRAHE